MKADKNPLNRSEFIRLNFQQMLDFVSKADFKPLRAEPEKKEADPLEGLETQVQDLIQFFAGVVLPAEPIRLNECSIIEDPKKFIKRNCTIIEKGRSKKSLAPYLHRLNSLKEVLTQKNLK